jgi:hypothetical protein
VTEQTEVIETVDDKELFQSAIEEVAPEPVQETVQETAEPETAERPRDEKGRFVAKEPEQAPQADAAPIQQQPEKEEAQVPSWRLRELREQREATERRLQEREQQFYAMQGQFQALQRQLHQLQQPKQEPVDFFQNPEAALQQRIDPLQSQFSSVVQNLQRQLSETRAIAKYGAAEFEAMEKEVQSLINSGDSEAHQLRIAVTNSADPADTAMRWYQDRKVRKEVGNDPAAYKQRLKDELLKDPEFQKQVIELARGQTSARPVVNIPPSINRATGAGNSHAQLDDGDMNDRALFQHAISARR